MREIKFRAWDKEDKRMITDTQEFIPLIVTNKGVFKLSPLHEENLYTLLPIDRFEIMQYTGLKDKNGKEIYEGDIVKYTNFIDEIYNKEIGVCVFEQDECNFCLQRTTINEENYQVPTTIHTIYLISNVTYANDVSYEVIGNIYENPELLKGGRHE